MKRTMLFVALAYALPLSIPAYANSDSTSQDGSSWSEATKRVEGMNDRQGQSPGLVKQAQERLSSLGKDVGAPHGQMNSKTEQALSEFQKEKGLQPTGQLDQQTLAALDLNQSGSAATGGSASGSQGDNTAPAPSDAD